MLRGWHHHSAGLSLHSVALNVSDRSEKRSRWKRRAERKSRRPAAKTIKTPVRNKTCPSCWQCQRLKWIWTLLTLISALRRTAGGQLQLKSKAAGSSETVWVSIYQLPLLQVLDKTSIFCNILSLSNWQIDVSPETLYWQPNVVEARGSQDRDQRPQHPHRPRRRSVTPELWYFYNIPLSPLRLLAASRPRWNYRRTMCLLLQPRARGATPQKRCLVGRSEIPIRHILSSGLAGCKERSLNQFSSKFAPHTSSVCFKGAIQTVWLFPFKTDGVSLGGERFPVKCSVTLFCTQGSRLKVRLTWRDTRIVTCLCLRRLFFLNSVLVQPLQNHLVSCVTSQRRLHDTQPRSLETHTGNCLHTGWVEVLRWRSLMFGISALLGGDCFVFFFLRCARTRGCEKQKGKREKCISTFLIQNIFQAKHAHVVRSLHFPAALSPHKDWRHGRRHLSCKKIKHFNTFI